MSSLMCESLFVYISVRQDELYRTNMGRMNHVYNHKLVNFKHGVQTI